MVGDSAHPHAQDEHHLIHRTGWLRAAVLGANDGIVSTGSLIVGVAAANAARADVILAGIAGLAAGALSMAAGEYVSVSTQADTERADLAKEAEALRIMPEEETRELALIYQERGLSPELADQVARALMASNPLEAHARDELGISSTISARPMQAAWASAASFTLGAILPLIVAAVVPMGTTAIVAVILACLLALALTGALSARAGGAPLVPAIARVTLWGLVAMAVTAGIGWLVGAAL